MTTLNLRRYSVRTVAVLAGALGLAAGAANANLVLITGDTSNSTEGFCNFDGSINYDYLGGSLGEVTFTLTNTTDPDIGGFLTGFVFNVGGHPVALDLTSATHPFLELSDEKAQPYGKHFVSGAALGGSWEGGGSPNAGIKVGDTGVFSFDLTSADAGVIDASTFLTGEYDFNFVARFKGLNNGKSDKVPGGEIPAPGSVALLGLAGLTAARRRR